mmetsp:Transcript_30270/g.27561  ORF Transcript_30270/g.27561 Transcript_30270/m.27561 type:complete len:143 (+) Transcript_30270:3-431(+)
MKKLENALSNFKPKDEHEPTEAELKKKRANYVVRAPDVEIIPRKLIKGGIDCTIVLDVKKEEALRRALGRRLDPQTGTVYHLEDNPPPVDNSPLVERLVPINDNECSEAALINRLVNFDKNRKQMEEWIKMFGDEENGINCL